MEIYIRDIELLNKSKALLKTNWTEKKVMCAVFVEKKDENWILYQGEIDYNTFEAQCKKLKVPPDEVRECFMSRELLKDIAYDLDLKKMKFEVLMRIKSDSQDVDEEDSFIELTYSTFPVKEANVTVKMMTDLLLEMKKISDECNVQKEKIKKYQIDYEYIQKSFEDLQKKHVASEKKLMTNFLHLLNSKKISVNDSTFCRNKTIDTSTDSEKSKSQSNDTKGKYELSITQKTPSKIKASTSKNQNSRKTPMKRTPSKNLQNQIESITSTSDSEMESFGIIKKSGVSRSVFNGQKITPIKPKEPEIKRESSIELRVSKKSNESTLSSTSESESKKITIENAQRLDLSDNSFKVHSSHNETSPENKNVRIQRKREMVSSSACLNAKKQKFESIDSSDEEDPYNVLTIDILKNI
ncbi:hypothetical protein PVAND_010053 [Polypedilum vanderplanki]|uniref:Uncharacterized protein n=1 Tax=Polypedilum vanderplanki TaxID=319348 RepID=A0A9J6CFH0_POLVA|nr:hypothetical protein PVAND_010053 [Polypedilum vanderplanki]